MVAKVRFPAQLLLEQEVGLALLLLVLLLRLVPHLVVNLDFILGHLDVFLNDAYFLLLFGPLEAEI